MREFAPLDDSQGNDFSYYSNQAMNKSFVKGNEQELRSCSPSVVGLCCRSDDLTQFLTGFISSSSESENPSTNWDLIESNCTFCVPTCTFYIMGVQENGSGHLGMSGVPLGSKNKYRRMDYELTDHSTKGAKVQGNMCLLVLHLHLSTMFYLVMIQYSEKYFDDTFEYRHVVLPPEVAKLLPKNRLLSELSTRGTEAIWLELKQQTKELLWFLMLLKKMEEFRLKFFISVASKGSGNVEF
ncbi:hypothetical protein L6452_43124 [Arctium lappa]|uniref:Uncharacterized protein n=1 Tax=Arctium lappa TaxID=4217 RepID=A0ACB8XKI5_ARCLA|nr:hypothetical protein L6452_43124 [Arctium lappa]